MVVVNNVAVHLWNYGYTGSIRLRGKSGGLGFTFMQHQQKTGLNQFGQGTVPLLICYLIIVLVMWV